MGGIMSVRLSRLLLLSSTTLLFLCNLAATVSAQAPGQPPGPPIEPKPPTQPQANPPPPENVPTITVETTKKKPPPKRQAARPSLPAVRPATEPPEVAAHRQLQTQVTTSNTARDNIYTQVGANSDTIGKEDVQRLPQAANAPIDKVLLQTLPGVAQDSAASGVLHIRNEHANVQYRINGIMLPDGAQGFGQVLESGFIGSLSLVTGALPAEFGLRTAALVDIKTREGAFDNGGQVSIYGGQRETFTPSFEYGGTIGGDCRSLPPAPGVFVKAARVPGACGPVTEYFVTGRYFTSNLGIENPTSSVNAIHDVTTQSRGFAYVSTIIDPTTRVSFIGGASLNKFQVPNNPGQAPNFTAFGVSNFDSSLLNENQIERNYYSILALQKSLNDVDLQLSYFNRYSSLHFTPDLIGDLVFNGVASDVYRRSVANGAQGDASYRLNPAHTLRAGFTVTGEKAEIADSDVVLPLDAAGNPIDAPFAILDTNSKLGWVYGVYVQDEWKLTDQVTINAGLRFDQMDQIVSANQLSPRLNVVFKPYQDTAFHIGYARYFTPPLLVTAFQPNLAAFFTPAGVPTNTGAPPSSQNSPVLPERAHVFDAGVNQTFLRGCRPVPAGYFTKAPQLTRDCETLELGVDAYYKVASDLLDDGQFGQALVLTEFNYERAENIGIEFTAKYRNGNFNAYGNLAVARQRANTVATGQSLFAPDELTFIANNWIYTDHTQIVTASAGISYLWWGSLFTADVIYGSGLRSGFANTDHVPAYAQVNAGVSHEFAGWNGKPLTLRFDVLNLFDTSYVIRDGTGIGVFAPQFGPRRAFLAGVAQKL
jgi:outer membrane receptor protein involved in Fe transport